MQLNSNKTTHTPLGCFISGTDDLPSRWIQSYSNGLSRSLGFASGGDEGLPIVLVSIDTDNLRALLGKNNNKYNSFGHDGLYFCLKACLPQWLYQQD